ncbi:hypothetical protein BD779DRAFT_1527027 [Infundibulicybe gibba]|nr:hypothetical protein BD779DRAFT_1527027 [Infundibulicybe gibba]
MPTQLRRQFTKRGLLLSGWKDCSDQTWTRGFPPWNGWSQIQTKRLPPWNRGLQIWIGCLLLRARAQLHPKRSSPMSIQLFNESRAGGLHEQFTIVLFPNLESLELITQVAVIGMTARMPVVIVCHVSHNCLGCVQTFPILYPLLCVTLLRFMPIRKASVGFEAHYLGARLCWFHVSRGPLHCLTTDIARRHLIPCRSTGETLPIRTRWQGCQQGGA